MSHYMTDKLEFIGLFSFKSIFEKDGGFAQILFLFYVPFRFAGKEPKWRPKERGGCGSTPVLWNLIPIALFVPSFRSSLSSLSAFRTLRSAWLFRPLFCKHSILSGFFALNTPKMRSVGEHFCRNVCTALRSIPWKPAVQNLPRSFFLLSLVTFLPFSFSKEKEKESNEKITWFKFLSLYPSYTILKIQTPR